MKEPNPYFHNESLTLYLDETIERMKRMPKDSVDMIFADPPYYLSNGGITVKSGKMVSVNKAEWDESNGLAEDFKFHAKWIKAARRILKPNGTIWISGTYHSIYLCGHALQNSSFAILNDISWFKPNGAPNISCRYFTASHETLLWAKKSKDAKHTFNYEAMKYNKWESDVFKKEDKQMRSVWCIPTPGMNEKKSGKHPTQKPLALLERVILSSTNEGDVILDPFNGSGTTGVAALKLNRKYIGIDNVEEYLDMTISRIKGTMEII
jgi:site-specific DNA-methyltransferase (adenine-specific)